MSYLNVFAISGSTRKNSSNLQILNAVKSMYADEIKMDIYPSLAHLPHFNPDLDMDENVPESVEIFRKKISHADGVLICTPEYVFSLPGSLKNAIEWTVSTTIFSEKPVSLITASGLGEKAHESLKLIMKTIYAKFDQHTELHIKGARTKINDSGIKDPATLKSIEFLMSNFITQMKNYRVNRS